MTRTIAERLEQCAADGFVGRARELAALSTALTAADPPFVAAFLHGPGGIGKSRLLHAALADPVPGVRSVVLDGRDVEPTPRGLRHALGRALGVAEPEPGTAAIVAAITADPRRTVLAIDTYEVLGLLDTWLRTTFLPALPASVVTVFAGRDRPSTLWHTTPGWTDLVAEFRLTALAPGDALRLLRARGLDDEQARCANDFARGHPLALVLAAASLRADPAGPPAPAGLLESFLGLLPAGTVPVVEAASTVRRVTEPILRAVLGVDDARAAFDTLRALPFTEPGADGLLLHDVVRDTVGQELAVRDPDARRAYRRRAARFFTERACAERGDLWQVTADLMFLIENPVVRDACFPSTRPEHPVEPARPEDGAAIAAIAARHETPAAAAALARWWARHPETFAVAREADGEVAAFVQIAELGVVDPTLLDGDPVARPWLDHLAAAPPARVDRVLLMRRWLGRDTGELRSPAVSACWLDVKRVYMELRPRLRRLYSTVVDLPRLGPIFLPLGFAPVGAPVGQHQAVWLDFGPGSVDGWLRRLVDTETDHPVSGLTGREFDVLRLLARGHSNREIGSELFISEKTAGRHISTIFVKLGVHTRAEAARIAAERGLAG
ncbi:MAG: helix-turn-helix transcriptional regulator [Pseudonocardia sp.]|nr:helix-turn-helix transcriptional regulator [Pseudonocardia sp.]